jgi:glutathione S-transferase
MAELVLYDYPTVPSPQKVRIAMAEKEIVCARVKVDLRTMEQKSAAYLRINPHGLVPALTVDGVPIYESTAIIDYFEAVHPEPPLLPRDPVARARARMIEEVIDNTFAAGLKMRNRLRRKPSLTEAEKKEYDDAMTSVLWHNEWLERELQGNDYFAGDIFSIADIAAIVNLEYQVGRLGLEIFPNHHNLLAWRERVRSRPSMRALAER